MKAFLSNRVLKLQEKNQFFRIFVSITKHVLASNLFETERLTLVYDCNKLTDGLGAQFQRIISLKALSENLGCDFEEYQIKDYDEAVFNNFDQSKKMSEIIKWSNLLKISVTERKKFSITITWNPTKLIYLHLIRFISKVFLLRLRVKIAFPAVLVDKNPEVYKICKNYLNEKALVPGNQKILKIVIHIRRGEVMLSQFSDRYLSFDYYENLLQIIIAELKELNVEFNVTVLCEKITNPVLNRYDKKVLDSLKRNKMNPFLVELNDGNFLLLEDELNQKLHTNLIGSSFQKNNDAYSDFKLMCEADILIISKSSFSFTAGLLNQSALKIFTPFWHNPSNDWFDNSEFENNSKKILSDWYTHRRIRERTIY